MLQAFQEERISDTHFTNSSGYGYDDLGRDSLDKVYARIFNAESALVRPHFVNGTHAIGAAIKGNVRPGDKILCATGKPYDTLLNVIGIDCDENIGSLLEYGVSNEIIDLTKDDKIDIEAIKVALEDKSIKLVLMLRSTGYGWRKAFSVYDIGDAI